MSDILVCGGLPRCATTYIYNELRRYDNVFRSRIKESFLFNRRDGFIDWKIGQLCEDKIYLDFTPQYIFSRDSLNKIKTRRINCFFVIRDFESYRLSLENYLVINGIRNNILEELDKDTFEEATRHAADYFPTIAFDDVTNEDIGALISNIFGLDLGKKSEGPEVRNSSSRRQHYAKALIHNRFGAVHRYATSLAFGLV